MVKRELRSKNMLGKQESNERLYLKRVDGGRGLKSMTDVCKETRLRVACYMLKSTNRWIQAAWRWWLQLDGERIKQEWKPIWIRVKSVLQKCIKQMRIEMYESKEQQNRLFKEQEPECHLWLTQNLHPRKTSSIISMLEQMAETRSRKVARGLADDRKGRVCYEQLEMVEHLAAGCKVLANDEYLARHERALMILAIT